MRFPNAGSWQIGIRADEGLTVFALWLRDVEGIQVPPSPLVPAPLDLGGLPARPGGAHEPRLGEEWLAWWVSLVDRRPRPPSARPVDDVQPADDTPDPLGLARLPALRGHVTRHWEPFQEWRVAHHRAHGTFADHRRHEDLRENDVVRQVETALGRRARPFRLAFTVLPVRENRVRQVGPYDYLVPERFYLGPGWPGWLRPVVEAVA
jgi:hypothetical protein